MSNPMDNSGDDDSSEDPYPYQGNEHSFDQDRYDEQQSQKRSIKKWTEEEVN